MSRSITGEIIVGEFGDLLIEKSSDIFHSLDIESEQVGDYLRVLGIPPIREAFVWSLGILLTLTQDNRLMIITIDHPRGVHIELDIPPIKRLYNLDPVVVLDVTGTLRPIDLGYIIYHQFKGQVDLINYYHDNIGDDGPDPLSFRINSIENIRHVSYADDIISYKVTHKFWMLILTHDNRLIYGSSLDLFQTPLQEIKVEYQIEKMAGKLLLTTSNEIELINLYDMRDVPDILSVTDVDYYVEDIILVGEILYTIDSQGALRKYDYEPEVMNTGFQAVRFLKDHNRPAVEDIGGNIYLLSNLRVIPYPIRLMNLNINPFRGLTKKPAMQTSPKAKLSAKIQI